MRSSTFEDSEISDNSVIASISSIKENKNTRLESKSKTSKSIRSTKKVSEKDFKILEIGEENMLKTYYYTVKQLKQMCKYYKLHVSGTRLVLLDRLYDLLEKSSSVIKIQNIWRKHIFKRFCKLRGPARFDRKLCINDTDFFCMDPIDEISNKQFFSYKDNDGMIYGFDIASLYSLFKKGGNGVTNPYTRNIFSNNVRKDINEIIILSKIININVDFNLEDVEEISPIKKIELRTISLFQYIDSLGNLTDHTWFWNLGRINLIRFLRELTDIWSYRAQLSEEVKRQIVPPMGNPFRQVDIRTLPALSMIRLRENALNIIERLVTYGIDSSSKSLGAIYVLSALTLVSEPAANTLPWLYDSVAPHN